MIIKKHTFRLDVAMNILRDTTLKDNKDVAEIIKTGACWKIGNGQRIKFWEDHWLGQATLRELFPRLYSVSIMKEWHSAEFGYWTEDRWEWKLQWRRDLFVWDMTMQNEMLTILAEVNMQREVQDRWPWTLDKSGTFTAQIFCWCLTKFAASRSESLRRKGEC